MYDNIWMLYIKHMLTGGITFVDGWITMTSQMSL